MNANQKKSVSFSDDIEYHEVLNTQNYTVTEFIASWYTPDEMRVIKEDCRRTVAMMRGTSSLGPHVCTRGLEGRTAEGNQQKKQSKVMVFMAIGDEIRRQRRLGINDPQKIADEYAKYARHCAAAAREMAHMDYLEAIKTESAGRRIAGIPFFKRSVATKPVDMPKVKPYGPTCPAA